MTSVTNARGGVCKCSRCQQIISTSNISQIELGHEPPHWKLHAITSQVTRPPLEKTKSFIKMQNWLHKPPVCKTKYFAHRSANFSYSTSSRLLRVLAGVWTKNSNKSINENHCAQKMSAVHSCTRTTCKSCVHACFEFDFDFDFTRLENKWALRRKIGYNKRRNPSKIFSEARQRN